MTSARSPATRDVVAAPPNYTLSYDLPQVVSMIPRPVSLRASASASLLRDGASPHPLFSLALDGSASSSTDDRYILSLLPDGLECQLQLPRAGSAALQSVMGPVASEQDGFLTSIFDDDGIHDLKNNSGYMSFSIDELLDVTRPLHGFDATVTTGHHEIYGQVLIKAYDRSKKDEIAERIARMNGPNTLKLLGVCNEGKREILLVYKFPYTTSLSTLLKHDEVTLDWVSRSTVASAVIQGLKSVPTSTTAFSTDQVWLNEDLSAVIIDFERAIKVGNNDMVSNLLGFLLEMFPSDVIPATGDDRIKAEMLRHFAQQGLSDQRGNTRPTLQFALEMVSSLLSKIT